MELNPNRVAWVDYAKGFCIVMVVMMHSTLGVEAAAGETSWMGALVAFAKPFRMPDFFLISGLFLARVIDRPWRTYLDTKVVHFAYFYVLWVTIQFAFKAPGFAAEQGWAGVAQAYALSFIEPFGTLWFIYLLPIFFVVTKALRDVPQLLLWLAAACLQIADVHTGWIVIDEFCARFVYFYSGYAFAPYVFSFAETVLESPRASVLFLASWAVFEAVMVFGGYSELPGVNLGLGFLGAVAVVAASVLHAQLGVALTLRGRELDRCLSRLLLANGRHAGRAPEIRTRSRSRHDRAHRDGGRRSRAADPACAREEHLVPLPVQAAGLGEAQAAGCAAWDGRWRGDFSGTIESVVNGRSAAFLATSSNGLITAIG